MCRRGAWSDSKSHRLLGPDLLASQRHPAGNISTVPAGQVREVFRFGGKPGRQPAAIGFRSIATRRTIPRMLLHVAALEVGAVLRFHEHYVFWKRFGVVTDVKAGYERVGAGLAPTSAK